jgi:hypothetical protein
VLALFGSVLADVECASRFNIALVVSDNLTWKAKTLRGPLMLRIANSASEHLQPLFNCLTSHLFDRIHGQRRN